MSSTPPDDQTTAGTGAGSELVLLEGVRHFLGEDEPGRCAQEVVDFLRQADI
ncbi:MAG: hypothetical protein H0T15_03285 [Thermoleophilaceae bacterium]|nr:hypothetical protein [Thermoleophilaceae bacterium]